MLAIAAVEVLGTIGSHGLLSLPYWVASLHQQVFPSSLRRNGIIYSRQVTRCPGGDLPVTVGDLLESVNFSYLQPRPAGRWKR